jgi:hypothetical protein
MIDRRMFSAALIASATGSLITQGAKAQIAPEVRARTSGARFADKPEDFAKLGIQPGRIEAFEDGMRTKGGPGGYEWWYFDSHLHDGSSLVIVFYTKPLLNPDGELAPFASLQLDRPDYHRFVSKRTFRRMRSRPAGIGAMSGSARIPSAATCTTTTSTSLMMM